MTTIHVRNPRNGSLDYSFVPPDSAELKATAGRLRFGQSDWEAAGLDFRVRVLGNWKQALIDRRDAIVSALTLDTGRTAESVLEFDSILGTIDRWRVQAPEILAATEAVRSAIPFISIRMYAHCYPLVGVVGPFDFAFFILNRNH